MKLLKSLIVLLFLFASIILSNIDKSDPTLYNDNYYNQTLGRDKDPKTINDLSKFQLWYRKKLWEVLTLPGLKFYTNFFL